MKLARLAAIAVAAILAAAPLASASAATGYIHPGAFCNSNRPGISKTGKAYVCRFKGNHDRWEPVG